MHVNMFEVAKNYLENVLGKYAVVAGFISPSHDEYVSSKLGKYWISKEHRY